MRNTLTILAIITLPTPFAFGGDSVQIKGSMQFWERSCDANYRCELPQPVGERIKIADVVEHPAPGTSLGTKSISFAQEHFTATLSVYLKRGGGTEDYLAGQSFIARDGIRIAECSHYAKDNVLEFIPAGFCAGYVHGEDGIKQYGMTFYK